uniref:Uncharacterized protein n=1 Tax=Ixodes scapularis TaxID=6945 RepID=A0A4D5RX73_IXOSC
MPMSVSSWTCFTGARCTLCGVTSWRRHGASSRPCCIRSTGSGPSPCPTSMAVVASRRLTIFGSKSASSFTAHIGGRTLRRSLGLSCIYKLCKPNEYYLTY